MASAARATLRIGERRVLRLEIVEGKDAQGDPCASLVAQFMRLDEACQVRVAELMRQHGRADHLRAELGCGETRGKGKRGPAETQSERSMPRSQRKPDGADKERERNPCGRLIGKREIGDDTAREQHRKPNEPAVLLLSSMWADSLREAASSPCSRVPPGRSSPPRSSSPHSGMADAYDRAVRGLRPALTPHPPLCYITTALTP